MIRNRLLGLSVTLFLASVASADVLPVGFISYDVDIPHSTAAFDISNFTGPNALPPDFPILTALSFASIDLTVDFTSGPSRVFHLSDFTLSSDGLSLDGPTLAIGGANPQPINASLTGTFSPLTVNVDGVGTENIAAGFSATVTPSGGTELADGDFAIISALGSPVTGSVPEPGSVVLLGTIVMGIALSNRSRLKSTWHKLKPAAHSGALPLMLVAACTILISSAQAQVKLSAATSPSTGVAGVSFVNVTGSGYPTGHGTIPAANATISFALTCGGAPVATNSPDSVINILGSTYRMHVLLPAVLTTNTYFVSVSGTTSDGTAYVSITCSQVAVTHTNPTLSACVPTSSLGIVAPVSGPAPVKALVPNGAWASSTTGIQVVQLETGGGPTVAPASIVTPDAVNSCAGNPATGEGVCVANTSSVYHLSSTNAVTPLVSASNSTTSFSGGSCRNCGVAVNALTNQAVIAMGLSPSPSGSGLQTLDLGSNTFSAPLPLFYHVSEDISIDPTRGYILSPNESNNYDIVQFNSTSGVYSGEFGRFISGGGGVFDSAAEDCSTGIALTVSEFANQVTLADLTQATFTAGSPGSWTGPVATPFIIGSYSAGLSGVTVAPGSGHLATVTGEFGGSSFSVLQLPSTSGSGTPSIVDYAYVQCIAGFNAGLDPHTVSAYTSPNDGRAYTVFASSPPPTTLAVVDMAAILAMPRNADGHTVSGGCLVTSSGALRFVSTH